MSKTSVSDFPFGVLTGRATSGQWGSELGRALLTLAKECPRRDFLLARAGTPTPYAAALPQLRRCLVLYGGLSAPQAMLYSLRSLKATVLSWANQLGVSGELRACQGHHACHEAGKSVRKHSRDDVLPQLDCQRKVLRHIAAGWVPVTALQRGVARTAADLDWNDVGQAESACVDVVGQAADEGEVAQEATDPESDSGSSRASASSEEDWCGSEDEAEELEFTGPWLLNAKSGWYHKTAVVSSEPCVRHLACRPQMVLRAGYVLHLENPCGRGFSACQHVGCWGNFARPSEPTCSK